jgi:hypothetical protein
LDGDLFCSAGSLAWRAGSRPGGRGTFLCFAKEKCPKERRAGCAVPPLRCGHAALLGPGVGLNSPAAQTTPALIRPALCYSPAHDGGSRTPPRRAAGASPLKGRHWWPGRAGSTVHCAGSGICRVAGLSSAASGGSGRALSERSEFSPTPPDASSARHREAARSSARLFFAYFLLAKQKKVRRPPGRNPARPASKNT